MDREEIALPMVDARERDALEWPSRRLAVWCGYACAEWPDEYHVVSVICTGGILGCGSE